MVALATRPQVENDANKSIITVDELIEERIDVTHRDNTIVRLARRVSAFYDRLTGPPYTEQDQLRATLAYVENIRRLGPHSF